MKKIRPQSIVVFRALQLGDLLCSVPVFRALRHAYPQSRITLASLPSASDFARRFSKYIDDFIPFPGYPGFSEITPDIASTPAFFEKTQQRRFDLAIQLHGSGSLVNFIAALMGAKITTGFYKPNEYRPHPDFFTPYPDTGSETDRLLSLLEFLEIPFQGDALEFPIGTGAHEELEKLRETIEIPTSNYVCLHPGARFSSRRCLPERFARVGDAMANHGYQVVITGSRDEAELAGRIQYLMRHPAVNVVGRTSLDALALLLQKARLLICNDKDVSCVAAALRVPSVVLITGSDPSRGTPLDRQSHHIVPEAIESRRQLHEGAA